MNCSSFEALHRETTAFLEPLAASYWQRKLLGDNANISDAESMDQVENHAQKGEATQNASLAYRNFIKSYMRRETASLQKNEKNDSSVDKFTVNDADINCYFNNEKGELMELKKCADEAAAARSKLKACQEALGELNAKYQTVAISTSSLHDACDQLMADQTRLAAGAEEIRSKLYYFDHVEPLMQKLNSTHLTVGGQAFTHALATIEECLTFLREQPDYKEASVYISKYEQCLSRALTAVKSYILSTLNTAAKSARDRQNPADGANETDAFSALYGVFAAQAQSVRQVIESVETKFDRAQEYQSVLADCHLAYFSHRDSLLRPSVTATIVELTKKYANSTCTLTRTGCGLMLRLCEDEYRLFFQFFTRPSDLLHDFIERMCHTFYDILRPMIVHSSHLETLAELCTILKVEMLEDRCAVDGEMYDGFARVINELVGDIGERLVYRASMYGQTDIQGYNPAAGDLAYPEKLQMMADICLEQIAPHSTGFNVKKHEEKTTAKIDRTKILLDNDNKSASDDNENKNNNDDGDQNLEESGEKKVKIEEKAPPPAKKTTISAVDLHGLWYPTVRRTVLCLSKLYKCLDATVFQGVSQEIISMCLESLSSATEKIASQKRPLDGQLFLVKHLLILREQTSPYRSSTTLSVKDTSVDFTKFKDSFGHLLNQTGRWFVLNSNNAFLEFLFQVPLSVTENKTDGRRIMDLQLKSACQKLISIAADSIVLEMVDFLNKAEVMVNSGGKESAKSHPFLNADFVHEITWQAYRKLKENWSGLMANFSLYIANAETEHILLVPIKRRISEAFNRTAIFINSFYSVEEQQIIAFSTNEQLNLIMNQ